MGSDAAQPSRLPQWDTARALATAHAPYLRRLLAHTALDMAALADAGPGALLDQVHTELAALEPDKLALPALMAALRRAKADVALIVALADLSGAWPLAMVTQALSDFADRAIDLSLQAALARNAGPRIAGPRTAGPRTAGPRIAGLGRRAAAPLVCLALGKLGGHELNYSSDVDLIFFFDELLVAHEPDASSRLSQCVHTVARLLQDRTEDGYVFRVDLRLRPDPGATPPAISMAAAETYYQTAALTWERAAYTRARVCAGNISAGTEFLQRLSGWVWRRNLDFSAIRDIDALRMQILDHYDLATFSAAGFDVKRGIGGIREIEFLVQLMQLVHGGRRLELRTANTPHGLAALARAGLIPAADAETLARHYAWLRTVEHRLQMQDDAQIHTLPKKSADRADVAHFCGVSSLDAFDGQLAANIFAVHEIYERILGKSPALPTPSTTPAKRAAKIANSAEIFARWETARYRALAHPRARAALARIMPVVLDVFASAPEPAAALAQWDTLLSRLPSGVVFLEMFEANPKLLTLIAEIFSLSPSLGRQLAQQPHLLDAVLEPAFFASLDAPCNFPERMDVDGEARLHRLARWTAEQQFRHAVHVLQNISTPLQAAAAQSRAMDQAATHVLALARAQLAPQYGAVPASDLSVVALGSWGGSALGVGADLDIVLISSGPEEARSSGPQRLSTTHYHNRLGQSFIALMTAQTPSGRLAEIDMRLRPSGAKGLLVVNASAFRHYQADSAWTWEHMALTRARCITGAVPDITQLVRDILCRPRNTSQLRDDVLDMRRDMDQHRAPHGIWDMKLNPGGLVDIEFIGQYLMLRHAADIPAVLHAQLPEALEQLAHAGALTAADAALLTSAWEVQFGVRMVLALCAQGDETLILPRAVARAIGQLTGSAGPGKSVALVSRRQRGVMAIWQKVFGELRVARPGVTQK